MISVAEVNGIRTIPHSRSLTAKAMIYRLVVAGGKNLLVMACLYNFHVAVNCCQTKCCWGHVRGEHIDKALILA